MHRRIPRNQELVGLIVLLFAGALLLTVIARNAKAWPAPESLRTYSASASQDCAGRGAWKFGIWIDITQQDMIVISVYEAPSFESPVTFSFPSGAFNKHDAVLYRFGGIQESLSGKVEFFQAVQAITIEGRFNLQTPSGEQFIGKFKAEWGDVVINCDLLE